MAQTMKASGEHHLEVPREPGCLERVVAAPLLLALMVLGGFFLWLGIPLGWLWIASQLTSGTQPTAGPYALIAIAIPLSMVVVARLLRRIDRLHERLTGRESTVHVQLPWLKSMRGERHTHRPTTALDLIMLVTAGIAVVAMIIWFIGFAGNPLPNS